MRRKISALFLAMSMLTASTIPLQAETLVIDGKAVSYNEPAISLYVNHNKVETTQMNPVNINNRVLVPMREVFEAMGAQVTWNGTAQTVTVVHGTTVVILGVSKKEAYVNGKLEMMDVPPQVINSKVMIPIRFVSESLGLTVFWDSKERAVYIADTTQKPQVPDASMPDQGGSEAIIQTEQSYSGTSNAHDLSIAKESYEKTKITNVTLKEVDNKLRIVISASSAISDAQVSLLPGKVVVDIKNSVSGLQNSIAPASNTYVKSIRTSQFTNDTVRVVFDLCAGALVKVNVSGDRKQFYVTLDEQKLEALEVTSQDQSDVITLKGLSSSQLLVTKDEKNKKIIFTVNHMMIEQTIDWNKLNCELIEHFAVSNNNSKIIAVASLKQWGNYQLVDTSEGVKLVIKKQTTSGSDSTGGIIDEIVSGGQDNENSGNTGDNSQTVGKPNLNYISSAKPVIALDQLGNISVNQLKITDDYRNKKLIFDLGKDYSSMLPEQTKTIGDAYVKSISVTNNGTTKITVNTATIYNYYVYEKQNGLSVQLVRPSEKFSKIVVVDIGHGGADSGAVANNVKEKVVNYDQGMALFRLLEADPSIKVYMTRETDVYPTLQFRATLANEIGADLFVSLHNNSASPNIVGTETLYFPSTSDVRGKKVAQIIQNAIVSNCGMNNRGIKARSDLYVLKNTNMPAVLIETGFLTNASEAAKISSPSFIVGWSKAVYEAIMQSFDVI